MPGACRSRVSRMCVCVCVCVSMCGSMCVRVFVCIIYVFFSWNFRVSIFFEFSGFRMVPHYNFIKFTYGIFRLLEFVRGYRSREITPSLPSSFLWSLLELSSFLDMPPCSCPLLIPIPLLGRAPCTGR